jgi:hypothetical protein
MGFRDAVLLRAGGVSGAAGSLSYCTGLDTRFAPGSDHLHRAWDWMHAVEYEWGVCIVLALAQALALAASHYACNSSSRVHVKRPWAGGSWEFAASVSQLSCSVHFQRFD